MSKNHDHKKWQHDASIANAIDSVNKINKYRPVLRNSHSGETVKMKESAVFQCCPGVGGLVRAGLTYVVGYGDL